MKKLLAALLLLISATAHAQSTAEQTVPGVLSTTGCPSGQTSCFLPLSSANPLPIGVYAPSGATSGYVLTSNGPGALSTFQPGGGGGAGNPGGTNTQIQYNNSGVFGGVANASQSYKFLSSNAAGVPSYFNAANLVDPRTFGAKCTGNLATGGIGQCQHSPAGDYHRRVGIHQWHI